MWGIFNFRKKRETLSSISKKGNMKFDKNKSLDDLAEEYKNLDFQWIKGETIGTVEKFSSFLEENGVKYILFEGGSRVNVDLLEEYMEAFPSSPVNVTENPVLNSPISPPRVQNKTIVNVDSINYSGNGNSQSKESPIHDLLRKQKPNEVKVNLSLNINLPPKSLYDVLTDSFEDAEDEIVDYVISGINIEDIKQSLADSIKNTYYKKDNKKEKEDGKS